MKNRVISLVLIFCMVMTGIPFSMITAFGEENDLPGDADNNKKVELQDVNLIERFLAEDQDAQRNVNQRNADVNSDGQIDDEDIRLIKEYLVGNINLTRDLKTITFDTDGGTEVQPVKTGKGYTYKGKIPTPAKDNYLFVKWIKEDGSTFYQNDEIINKNIKLKAVYEAVDPNQMVNITSFSLENQKEDVTFEISSKYDDVAIIKDNIKLVPKDGSDPVEFNVTPTGGTFTLSSKEGFTPGASYELTLGKGINFVGKDEKIRTAYFVIKKAEEDNLKYNENLIFIKDTEEMNYNINGKTVPVLEAAFLSNDKSTEAIKGTFNMSGNPLKKDDVICIYENIHPEKRDYSKNDYEDDAIAYVRITSVKGNQYGFESLNEEDTEEVLAMPDSIPFLVKKLPENGGKVNKKDYDAYARVQLGMTEEPEFAVHDILIFYTGSYEKALKSNIAVYGQITEVNGEEITYKLISKEDIEDFTGLFVSQDIDGKDLLTEKEKKQILKDVKDQAEESGFAEEASNRMVQSALETEDIQNKLKANGFTGEDIAALRDTPVAMAGGVPGANRAQFVVEGINIVPTFVKNPVRFKDGIGIELDINLLLSLEKRTSPTKISSLKIDLSTGFVQEFAFGIDVNIDDRWEWVGPFYVLKDLNVAGGINIQNYSAVSVSAKLYTISDDASLETWKKYKLQNSGPNADPRVKEAIRKADMLASKAKYLKAAGESVDELLSQIDDIKSKLPKFKIDGVEYSVDQLEEALGGEDVSKSFEEVFKAETEAENKVGLEQLMDRYTEVLNQECDWVVLFDQKLFSKEILIKVVAIRLDINFLISANVNVAIGADLEYQVGKRYTFWIHILEGTAGSGEIDLIDERFGFQFYVMGTMGIRAGIKAEVAFGIISTRIGSIGANVEFGPYLRLWGYFIYIYERMRPANTVLWNENEEVMGAMYVEFGLYVLVKFKAQVFNNMFKYEPTLYNQEFPLVTAGVAQNVYDFALQPSKDDVFYIEDEDHNSINGIQMKLPDKYRNMRTIDLKGGGKQENVYDHDKFIITFTDSHFRIDENGVIHIDLPEDTRFMKCDMRIVWKTDKIAFSKYDMDLTIPVVWSNYSESEKKEKFTAKVAVGNQEDGYKTVWTKEVSRIDVFDLPSTEEILELINYNNFNAPGGNLKYEYYDGYSEDSENISLSTDKTFYFEAKPQEYTLTVTDVEKPDGSKTSMTFKAEYGEDFNLEKLKETGADNLETKQFTSFNKITDSEGNDVIDPVVNMDFVEKYGNNAEFKAEYNDEALTATYKFIGVGDIEPVEIKFKKGTIPYMENLNQYVEEKAGKDAIIESISPAVAASESSVTYTVSCKVDKEKPKFDLKFVTNGGNVLKTQRYAAGSVIIEPTVNKTGYEFAGWFTEPEFKTPFDFATKMPEKDLTLYAKWTGKTYKVSFDTDYDTTPEDITVKYGEPYGQLPVLRSDEFRFAGWFTEKTGGTEIKADTVYKTAGKTTLYAHWVNKTAINESWIVTEPLPQTTDYNEKPQSFQFNLTEPYSELKKSIKVTYKPDGTNQEFTEAEPVNAGTYEVKLKREMDDNYLAFEKVYKMRINKIHIYTNGKGQHILPSPRVTHQGLNVTVEHSGNPVIKSDGEITFEMLKLRQDDSAVDSIETNKTGKFTVNQEDAKAGRYTFKMHVAEGTNYFAIESKAKGLNASDFFSLSAVTNENFKLEGSRVLTASADTGKVFTADGKYGKAVLNLSPEELMLKKGKTFDILLDIDKDIDIWGILASVKYDKKIFELVGNKPGNIFKEEQFTTGNDLNSIPYKFLATEDDLNTVSSKGRFITLQFKVKDKIKYEETTISLENLEVVDQMQQVPVEKGNSVKAVVDNKAPVLNGIKDGREYYGETTVTIEEENLASLKVNGKSVTVKNNSFTLKPEKGKQHIVAIDYAGNRTELTVTVHEAESAAGTGDNSHMLLWIVLLIVTAGSAGTIFFLKKKKK